MFKVLIKDNRLEVVYDDEWEDIENLFIRKNTVFNPRSRIYPKVPKYKEETYKFFIKHSKKSKHLIFNLGWVFYFATELRDQIENFDELNKLKN
jgi:hypothetical protein